MRALTLFGVSIFILMALCAVCGVRVNTTKSIPIGLYWTSDAPVQKGAYVAFCPPQSPVFEEAKARGYIGPGFCPDGYGLLMKRVVAVQGDEVSIKAEGVRVNGKLLKYSALTRTDKAGRPMPKVKKEDFTLNSEELLLMSDISETSFDSRYYGLIYKEQIQSVIKPILVW